MDDNTIIKEIKDDIYELLKMAFNINCEQNQKFANTPLIAYPFELTAIQMYQFLMLIEEKYYIYITPDMIEKYGFLSINNIEKLIKQVIHKGNNIERGSDYAKD